MGRARATLCAIAAIAACACSDDSQTGTDEVFRVRGAQFIKGELPGDHPVDAGPVVAGDAGTPSASGPPKVRQGTTPTSDFAQGRGAATLGGWASKNALSVGIALDDVSSGYWVVPVGIPDPDPALHGDVTWSASLDFSDSVPVGDHSVRLVAFDDSGRAGVQALASFCVSSKVFDNLHICVPKSPKHELPKAVISLSWDTNVDLDLQVKVPGGRFVEPKDPITIETDGGAKLPQEAGRIDRDSNLACVIDGVRTENLVWQNVKPSGRFEIYANLFDSCKQPAVRFTASVYVAAEKSDGTQYLKLLGSQTGELLDFQANGGTARGLYVTSVVLK